MTLGGLTTGWARVVSSPPVTGSLKSLLEKPGVALGLALVAICGLIVGIISAVRVESMRKAVEAEGQEMRTALVTSVQRVLEGLSERSAPSGAVVDGAATAVVLPAGSRPSAYPLVERPRPPTRPPAAPQMEPGLILVSDTKLPPGVDAAGEVENSATGTPVLLVQNQDRDRRGAALLIFNWQKYDLVPADELHNTTGATFNVAPSAEGLAISTLDTEGDRFTVREYIFDGQSARPIGGYAARPYEVEQAFALPPWAKSPEAA
jgi:hypothetical protein